MAAQKLYGGVDVAGLQRPPYLAIHKPRLIGGGRGQGAGNGRGRREQGRGDSRVLDQVFRSRKIDDQGVEGLPIHGRRVHGIPPVGIVRSPTGFCNYHMIRGSERERDRERERQRNGRKEQRERERQRS